MKNARVEAYPILVGFTTISPKARWGNNQFKTKQLAIIKFVKFLFRLK